MKRANGSERIGGIAIAIATTLLGVTIGMRLSGQTPSPPAQKRATAPQGPAATAPQTTRSRAATAPQPQPPTEARSAATSALLNDTCAECHSNIQLGRDSI
jgi:hypothetical protein